MTQQTPGGGGPPATADKTTDPVVEELRGIIEAMTEMITILDEIKANTAVP